MQQAGWKFPCRGKFTHWDHEAHRLSRTRVAILSLLDLGRAAGQCGKEADGPLTGTRGALWLPVDGMKPPTTDVGTQRSSQGAGDKLAGGVCSLRENQRGIAWKLS